MPLRTIIFLLPLQLTGAGLLAYGMGRVRRLVRLHRTGVRVDARTLPDHVRDGRESMDAFAPVYQRVAAFQCPMLGKKRIIAESVASSRQSPWTPGERIPVIVSSEPPHAAVVATFRNLYLFPLVCLAAGTAFAVVLPVAILLKR